MERPRVVAGLGGFTAKRLDAGAGVVVSSSSAMCSIAPAASLAPSCPSDFGTTALPPRLFACLSWFEFMAHGRRGVLKVKSVCKYPTAAPWLLCHPVLRRCMSWALGVPGPNVNSTGRRSGNKLLSLGGVMRPRPLRALGVVVDLWALISLHLCSRPLCSRSVPTARISERQGAGLAINRLQYFPAVRCWPGPSVTAVCATTTWVGGGRQERRRWSDAAHRSSQHQG